MRAEKDAAASKQKVKDQQAQAQAALRHRKSIEEARSLVAQAVTAVSPKLTPRGEPSPKPQEKSTNQAEKATGSLVLGDVIKKAEMRGEARAILGSSVSASNGC